MISQQLDRRIQNLHGQITGTTKALIWLSVGITYAATLITFLLLFFVAADGWGTWAALIEFVSLPFVFLLLIRQMAIWELKWLSRLPLAPATMLDPVYAPEPQERAGSPQEIQIDTPAPVAEYPSYAGGYPAQER